MYIQEIKFNDIIISLKIIHFSISPIYKILSKIFNLDSVVIKLNIILFWFPRSLRAIIQVSLIFFDQNLSLLNFSQGLTCSFLS